MSIDFSFIISGDDLWATQQQIAPVIERALAGIGIDADQLWLDDLVAQIEVGKLRKFADEMNVDHISSDWYFTRDREEVEVLFMGFMSQAEAARLEQAIRSNFGQP